MASTEEAATTATVLDVLSTTPFACSCLTRMSAGTTNYTFRGILHQPLRKGERHAASETVIVKHAKPHVPGNKDFGLDLWRCDIEQVMLAALGQNFGGVITPRLLLADRTANLMVMEDVAGMTDLHSIMKSNNANAQVPVPAAAAIGKTLGAWLRRFHEWGSAPEQSILVEKVAQNRSMRNLKLKITYDIFIGVIEDFPDIMGDLRSILDEIRQMAVGEFAKEPGHDSKAGWGLIHGDFWTGNILFNAGTSDMAVIDWEFAQFGCWAYDVGQMIGDLYERHHYDNLEHTMSMTKQFAQGYGCVSDDMAFRVAIHAGVQVLGWYRRRAPGAPLPGSQSLIEDMVRLGTDLVVKGWTRDRAWFEDGPLAPLFT